MIANVLIVVSLVVTLMGLLGVKEQSIKKRMMALTLTCLGGLGVAFSQMGQYGLLSGLQQLPFRGLGLLMFKMLLSSVCKKNQITTLKELNGLRRFAPCTYVLMIVIAGMLIGVPGTGTFTGVVYAQMGYMYSYTGFFSYLGMIVNALSMILIAVIVFPILKEGFLYRRKDERDDGVTERQELTRMGLVKPSVSLEIVAAVVVLGMLVLSIWQGALTVVVSKIVENIM